MSGPDWASTVIVLLPSLGKRDVTAGSLLNLLDFSQVHNPALLLQQRTCPPGGSAPPPEIDD